MIFTSLASVSRPLWRLLERYQIDPEPVFRGSGLDPALLDEPRARYETESVAAAWAKAVERIGDPCCGLRVADVWSPTDIHALGCAFLASSTLRTGLKRLVRYVQVVDNSVTFNLEDGRARISLALTPINPFCSSEEEDAIWAFVTSLCRAGYGDQLNPAEVRFEHEAHACKEDYDSLFRCPVFFNSDQSALLFASADVDRPLPAPNRELARANDQILSAFLAKLQGDDLVTRIKTAIANELPSGSPSEEFIAKAVYMSPRSLRRLLSSAGTTYSQLLDAVRRELAEEYLADPAQSLTEIAFLLGFSELSAFSRAFMRWTGHTPSAFRDALCM